MSNNRIFYACQAVGISPFQTTPDWKTARGVQSVGVNTRFNLEQVFEIGQLAIYENIENIPDVEVSMEKVLDGHELLYHLLTQGAGGSTLVARSNQRAHLALSIYNDTVSLASGTPISQCVMSGVYLSQVSYNINVGGNATESVSVVGNHKGWLSSNFTFSGFIPAHDISGLTPNAVDGVNRRQDLVMSACRFPTAIKGISSSGTNNDNPPSGFNVAIQSIQTSANLGREQMLELGRKGAYARYVNFPVEISTSIDVMAKDGDFINAYEEEDSTVEDQIRFKMKEGLTVDLGNKNRLSSVNYGNADAGGRGSNGTIQYQFTTYNDFDVRHPADPGGFAPEF